MKAEQSTAQSDSIDLEPWPMYADDEVAAAEAVLRSGKVNYWTGEECRKFEEEFAAFHGARYAIALANGTVALELALIALGIGDGDEVIVTPRSFFASASCVVRVGATPVFADVDVNSQNVSADTISKVITPKTRAIIAVHLAGWPCDMPAICRLAEKHKLYVIEDCAQAHGAEINGSAIGTFGDVAAFSFCQDKIMTTAGEGGMLMTNSMEIWQSSWSFKDHGKSWEKVFETEHPKGFRWLHDSIGTNWRLTEFQAAVGRRQLEKLPEWRRLRNRNASRFIDALSDLKALRIPQPDAEYLHAYYKFYFFVRPEALKTGWSRDRILEELEQRGCPGWSGSCPEIYRESAFADRPTPTLPNAAKLGDTSVMLPVHPTLTDSTIDAMVGAIRDVVTEASR